MMLCIAMLAITGILSMIKGMETWLVIVAPLIILTEFSLFLYVVGILSSEPEYLQSSPDLESA